MTYFCISAPEAKFWGFFQHYTGAVFILERYLLPPSASLRTESSSSERILEYVRPYRNYRTITGIWSGQDEVHKYFSSFFITNISNKASLEI